MWLVVAAAVNGKGVLPYMGKVKTVDYNGKLCFTRKLNIIMILDK
jgi:hypothetical protein